MGENFKVIPLEADIELFWAPRDLQNDQVKINTAGSGCDFIKPKYQMKFLTKWELMQ